MFAWSPRWGSQAYAKLVRKAEGHEAVVKANHNKYLEAYHVLVNFKVGSNKDVRKCAEGLAKDFRQSKLRLKDWATGWQASTTKLDRPGRPPSEQLQPRLLKITPRSS